jgi:proteasome accessory factor C
MPNVHLSDEELTALAVGTRSLSAVMPKPFTKSLDGLLTKLLDVLPESRREEIRLLRESIDIVPTAIASKGVQWVEPLMRAMRDELSVEINYYVLYKRKAGRRRVDPYHLRFFAGTWYLVGYDHSIKRLPIFNLARIRELNPTERSFRRKPFSASDYFRDAIGITVGGRSRRVRIRLTGRVAETAGERVWPDGFKYFPSNDGTGVIEGHTGKLDDLLAWIASTGGEASVL